ncbi:MAG: iron-containing redox enzyme family protein [Solirubrobacterales bacterium]
MAKLPQPRGSISERLLDALTDRPRELGAEQIESPTPLVDEDLQLSLYLCYELSYRSFDGVDPRWEWNPSLIALRVGLESRFESALHEAIGTPGEETVDPAEMDIVLRAIAESDDGPSLSQYVERQATEDQIREFMIHRSAYQLKEADPHTWAIPRMHGPPKAAMVEIQADEYGGGRAERIHAQLFADAMDAIGLDSDYGAYLDRIPAVTLATVNLISLFGLNRRLLGAIVGHLALFEMTSSIPNRRYGDGLRRLGYDGAATEFFDEHVLADAVHENIAAVDLAGGLARQRPELSSQIPWGARALVFCEGRWAGHLLDAWERGRSSLLPQPTARALPA